MEATFGTFMGRARSRGFGALIDYDVVQPVIRGGLDEYDRPTSIHESLHTTPIVLPPPAPAVNFPVIPNRPVIFTPVTVNPTIPPRPVHMTTQQQPSDKFSRVADLISQGINAFVSARQGGQQQPPGVQQDYYPPGSYDETAPRGVGEDVGATAGKALGGVGDALLGIVEKHPLATLTAGVGVVLYLIKPKGGGYSRGR